MVEEAGEDTSCVCVCVCVCREEKTEGCAERGRAEYCVNGCEGGGQRMERKIG